MEANKTKAATSQTLAPKLGEAFFEEDSSSPLGSYAYYVGFVGDKMSFEKPKAGLAGQVNYDNTPTPQPPPPIPPAPTEITWTQARNRQERDRRARRARRARPT